MNIYKVLPDLDRHRQLALWHKALRSQWSAEDLPWTLPQGVRSQSLRDQLARILTPVLMGEQSALYSVSAQIPRLGHRSEVEAQFYLTTWAVDEARHTELFARFYRRLDRQPLSIRRFQSGYLFQSKITASDTAEWLSGVLVSEVLATLVMKELRRLDFDPVLSQIANGILEDEARHLGFNHLYLEERFAETFRGSQDEGETVAQDLRQRLAEILTLAPPMFEALEPDLAAAGFEIEEILGRLREETQQRLELSIKRGFEVATGARPEPAGASVRSPA